MKLEFYSLAIFVGILAATFLLAFLVNRYFLRLIRRSSLLMRTDPTNYHFLRHIVSAVIYMVGIGVAVYSLPGLRTVATSLLAGAGVLAVAVGFASQQALSNIVGGVFIVIFKPFRVNDRLEVKNMAGVVEDISLRHTVIRDFNNRRIIIPNSVISGEVIINSNFGEDKICKWVDVGISYDADLKRAKEIIREEILAHPMNIDPRNPEQIEMGVEQVPVRLVTLGDFSVNLRGWAWANNAPDAFQMGCDLLESIKGRFDAEGIEIPFPYRTIVHKENKHS